MCLNQEEMIFDGKNHKALKHMQIQQWLKQLLHDG